jgi:hypothetical protein
MDESKTDIDDVGYCRPPKDISSKKAPQEAQPEDLVKIPMIRHQRKSLGRN